MISLAEILKPNECFVCVFQVATYCTKDTFQLLFDQLVMKEKKKRKREAIRATLERELEMICCEPSTTRLQGTIA